MNKVILMGRLTKDVETRFTQTNTMVASFNLAVDRRIANKNGEKETDFINIVAWSKTAEFVSKYFKKGSKIAVIGRIQTRNYEDDKGQKHYITEVIAEEVYFAESKKEDTTSNTSNFDNIPSFSQSFAPSSDDDLPF